MKTIRRDTMCKTLLGLMVLLLCCGMYLTFSRIDAATVQSQDLRQQEEDYNRRLEYYLDLKSQGFLNWLLAKEKQLVEMINLTSGEIQKRSDRGDDVSQFNFTTIYARMDTLVYSYNQEISRLMEIYQNLDSLEYAVADSDIVLWEDVAKAKDDLALAIEDRELYTNRWYTNQDLATLIEEYSLELDTLILIYENLEKLGKNPDVTRDEQLKAEIGRQEQQVLSAVSQWGPPPALEEHVVRGFQFETDSLVKILLALDSLDIDEAATDPDLRQAVRRTKGQIVENVDQQLLDLAGYNGPYGIFGPTVTEYLDAWRKARMADLEIRFTEYEIIRQRLLDIGSEQDIERMLANELSSALLNYANGDYLLAEMQLDAVLETYSDKDYVLDPVIFYKGETLYARGFLEAASDCYRDVIEQYQASQYLTESILRMMQISKIYGRKNRFYEYYALMQEWTDRAHPQELNRAHLLAGHALLGERRYQQAHDVLSQVARTSPLFWEAHYLLGITFINLDRYDEAILNFERIASIESLPWTDIDMARLRNGSLLKLGLIAYQRGELSTATEYFQKVSSGFEDRDQSVIATAWASLKKGEYQASLDTVTMLLRDYLSSTYTYEALVLAAHCKRIMGETENALEDYRFVSAARAVFDLSDQYEEERQRLLSQEEELSRLERLALEQQDQILYPEIVAMRRSLNQSIESIRYRSDIGEYFLEDVADESQEIVDQIAALDILIDEARAEQREDLARKAEDERARLMKMLVTMQSKQQVVKSSYLMDHPVVSREAEAQYREQAFELVVRDLEAERARIVEALNEVDALRTDELAFGSKFELEVVEEDFRNLQNEVSQFRAWIAAQPAETFSTDLERWSDHSGFEIADISYTNLQNQQQEMSNLAGRVVAIEDLWEVRRGQIEQRMLDLDKQLLELQKNIETQQMNMEKMERERYFRTSYFDTTKSEVRIRPLIEIPKPDTVKVDSVIIKE